MIIMCCIAEPLVGWSKGYFGDRRDTTLRVITHMLIFLLGLFFNDVITTL